MGQFSLTHLLLLAVIALLFFGPKRLPQLGQSLGRAIKGFKEGLDGTDSESQNETRSVGSNAPEQLKAAETGAKTEEQTKQKDPTRQG